MLKKSLHIYIIDEQGNKVPFPSTENPAVLCEWNYTAERMSAAPTITGSLMYKQCLDDLWTLKEFVEFNGEYYYVDQTPTSSKSNEDVRYKHEITFTSERIALENVFFFDVVTSETEHQYKDRYRSNGTKFSFYGTLYELVSRLNDSLIYTNLYNPATKEGYHIVIDEGIDVTEEKEISLENVYFATALQEIYNQFKVPYYWKGKTCHVGYADNSISTPFEYGQDKGLLSISKTNANYRIINRISGVGSSDNIPYYYPNEDAYGTAIFETENIDKTRVESISLKKIMSYNSDFYNDIYTFCKNIRHDSEAEILSNSTILCHNAIDDFSIIDPFMGKNVIMPGAVLSQRTFTINMGYGRTPGATYRNKTGAITLSIKIKGRKFSKINVSPIIFDVDFHKQIGIEYPSEIKIFSRNYYYMGLWSETSLNTDEEIKLREDYLYDDYTFMTDEDYRLTIVLEVKATNMNHLDENVPLLLDFFINRGTILYEYVPESTHSFFYGNNKEISYQDSGISLLDISNVPCVESTYTFTDGMWIKHVNENPSNPPAKIKLTGRDWITPTGALMPPIYRDSQGAERFYNALNDVYDKPEGGKYIFENIYANNNQKEGIKNFDDIKPSIKGVKNADAQLLGEIADVAFDLEDSDLLSDDNSNEYIHSYFYIKLHVFNGAYGFNLLNQALESGAATINMTSGACARCAFELGFDKEEIEGKYVFHNPVVTDKEGALLKVQSVEDKDYKGDYIQKNKSDYVARQQDTSLYEVWVAVKKENSTFGVIMPNATNNYKPKIGDKFVITNILMPNVYVANAENELKEALVKYMSENNNEKFSFNITFSRIYLQQNPEIANLLNENARLIVKYNGHDYTLYVSSYSCKATNDILNEITVEITDEFTVGQSTLKEKITDVAQTIINDAFALDTVARMQKYFLSKRQNDIAGGLITFLQGLRIGEYLQGALGGYIDKYANAEIESIIVRKLAEFGALKVNGNSIFNGDMTSDMFVTGFLSGTGWGLTSRMVENSLGVSEKKYTFEVDDLIVRGAMKIYEMVVSQLLGENDNRVFTGMMEVDHYDAETETVWLKTQGGKLYNTFREGDCIMVQQYESANFNVIKNYELVIKEYGTGNFSDGEDRLDWVTFKNFTSDEGTAVELITEGDTFVRVDSQTDENRKGIVQIMSVGTATPYIDILHGLKTDPLHALKGRIGNLSGITSPLFGQLEAFGEYLVNLYATGDFRLRRTGESVDAKIEALKAQFATRISQTSYELTDADNLLRNGVFQNGMECWVEEGDNTVFITFGSDTVPLMFNTSTFTAGDNRVNMEDVDGRMVLHLMAAGIVQSNDLITRPGYHMEYTPSVNDEVSSDAKNVPNTVYMSIRVLAKTSGTLTIGPDIVKQAAGDVNEYNTLYDNMLKFRISIPNDFTGEELGLALTKDIEASDEWQMFTWKCKWCGDGDFVIRYTGECYISMAALTTIPVEELRKTVSTQIIQTASNIRLLAEQEKSNSKDIASLQVGVNEQGGEISMLVTHVETLQNEMNGLPQIYATKSEVKQTATSISQNVTTTALEKYFSPDGSLLPDVVNTTGLVQTTNLDSWLAEQQGNGKIPTVEAVNDIAAAITGEKSSPLYKDYITSFNTIFSAAVNTNGDIVKQADISTFIKKVPNGTDAEGNTTYGLESGILLRADQIDLYGMTNLHGVVSANGNFKILEDGSIEAVNGKFSGTVTATKGAIAGFKIEGDSLNNDSFTPNAHIRLKNEKGDCEISLGTGEQTGIASNYLALLRNKGASDWWYNGRNTAMMYDVSGADFNMAFEGEGHGLLNGCVQGWKAQKITLENVPLGISTAVVNMADGDKVFVSSSSGGNLRLPHLLEIRRFVGNAEAVFALELTITGLPGGNNFLLYGRCNTFNTPQEAQIKNNNGGDMEHLEIGGGDSLTLILTNVNGDYEAYIKNKQI